MKHLIVYAHPNPKSFCRAVVDKVLDILEMNGEEATVSNLYEMEFNPVLGHRDFEAIAQGTTLQDVEDEQRLVEWADQITFIYPIWWTGMPAIMKGYIDRVFTYDFAYKMTEHGAEGLLNGKKVKIINTMGTPNEYYEQSGMIEAMKKTSDTGIFNFCGMEVSEHIFLGGIPSSSFEHRLEILENLHKLYQ
ncbi:MAG TPA: NAD(P)H dehydrogenase [Porphyromonadaceae bacterium]|nr:NAD(P)H dehydrogenase [Porphyromonadaceae bacterium]